MILLTKQKCLTLEKTSHAPEMSPLSSNEKMTISQIGIYTIDVYMWWAKSHAEFINQEGKRNLFKSLLFFFPPLCLWKLTFCFLCSCTFLGIKLSISFQKELGTIFCYSIINLCAFVDMTDHLRVCFFFIIPF